MLVAKHHPLSRLPLSEALPFLKVFTCCCKQVNQSREDEYASLLEDLQKNPTDSTVIVDKKPEDGGEEEEDDDVKFDWRALKHLVKEEDKNPFRIYGTGITNYFTLLRNMILLFGALTILACFQMAIYRSFDGLGNLEEWVTLTADVSFGNMGFSAPVCSKMPVDWVHDKSVKMSIGCQRTTQITEILSSGMMLDLEFPGGK